MCDISNNWIFIIAILCYAVYKIVEILNRPKTPSTTAKLMEFFDLKEKGVITQAEFDAKKTELLD